MYAGGQTESEAIDLGAVTDVPISFFVSNMDETCAPDHQRKVYDEFTNAPKTLTVEAGFTEHK